MAKKKKGGGGSSWFTAVKKAFRSPTKPNDDDSKSRNNVGLQDHHQQLDQQDQDNKKREKRRWIFRKASYTDQQQLHPTTTKTTTSKDQQKHIIITSNGQISKPPAADAHHPTQAQAQAQQGQALTVAAASAAKAAAATAEAAAEIARLIRPHSASGKQYHYAAVIIQAAFRAYLARRALEALKGIVKLQAFIRGDSIRRQTKAALRNIQALIQMQSQTKLDQRTAWISQEKSRKSMFAEANNLWDKHMHDIRRRKSLSREGTNHPIDEWDEFPCVANVNSESMLRSRKEAALRREKALAFALSQQIWGFDKARSLRDKKDLDERTEWLNRWMATKQWENTTTTNIKASTDRVKDSGRTVPLESSTPRTMAAVAAYRQSPKRQNNPQIVSRHSLSHQRPSTPSSIQTRPLTVRSASPRCPSSRRSTSTATTPCLNSRYSYNKSNNNSYGVESISTTPNYMASTQSAKAKARSVSTPKQRPATPSRERNGAVRKRLSFPMREPQGTTAYTDSSSFTQSLRSPSFRSVCPAIERGNYQSYYPDSAYGEISPASTTHIRRWVG